MKRAYSLLITAFIYINAVAQLCTRESPKDDGHRTALELRDS
jgi:hypothetical protein